jgi:anti-anti-sigma factor
MMEKKNEITVFEHDNIVTVHLSEKFNFESHSEFRAIYINHEKHTQYILDFSKVLYIDSSVLGMLLLLREHNVGMHEKGDSHISIINCGKEVMNIFNVANFPRLFDIK